jgi:hypothetical protein
MNFRIRNCLNSSAGVSSSEPNVELNGMYCTRSMIAASNVEKPGAVLHAMNNLNVIGMSREAP